MVLKCKSSILNRFSPNKLVQIQLKHTVFKGKKKALFFRDNLLFYRILSNSIQMQQSLVPYIGYSGCRACKIQNECSQTILQVKSAVFRRSLKEKNIINTSTKCTTPLTKKITSVIAFIHLSCLVHLPILYIFFHLLNRGIKKAEQERESF